MKLHKELLVLRQKEKQITGLIIESLQKLEETRDYLDWGYSSLFDYLVRGLDYSETTAYQRQACIRLSKEVPEIKQKMDQGKLSLSSVVSAYKHIKTKPVREKRQILKQIENKSSREVKRMLAPKAPQTKIKEAVYQDKVILKLELSHKEYEDFKRLEALKSHRKESLFNLLVEQELKLYSKTNYKPTRSKNPRQIAKRLRNAVLKDAGYKCQHKGCEQTKYLQVDHIISVKNGGTNQPENLQVLCGAHNRRKG